MRDDTDITRHSPLFVPRFIKMYFFLCFAATGTHAPPGARRDLSTLGILEQLVPDPQIHAPPVTRKFPDKSNRN